MSAKRTDKEHLEELISKLEDHKTFLPTIWGLKAIYILNHTKELSKEEKRVFYQRLEDYVTKTKYNWL
jgi:hypothetical protein